VRSPAFGASIAREAGPRPARIPRRGKGSRTGMLAIVAAIIFAIAWIINATGTATNAWFSVTGLLLIGLACLALHQAGIGSAWVRRR
jgi:hypothetical protein